jgi:hypothetical protein
LKAFGHLLGALLGRPDLEATTMATLHADVIHLYERIESAMSQLTEDVRSKVDPVEALELIVQTVSHMGQTAQTEKRRLRSNVAVHGLTNPQTDPVERRLFVRAIAELDIAHVALLHRIHVTTQLFQFREKALLGELVQRGFVERVIARRGRPATKPLRA